MTEIITEYEKFLKSGGLFALDKSVLKMSGPDASDFLHRLTTQNVKTMGSGMGAPSAILQSNAMLVSLFDLYHCGNFFLIITDRQHGKTTAEFFEKFHFAENLEIKDITDNFCFLSVQGLQSQTAVQKVLKRAPAQLHEVVGTEDSFIFCEADFGQQLGYHLLIKSDRAEQVITDFEREGFLKLSEELWRLLRVEAGHFTFGADITEKNLILEGALDKVVSRNKGCYPGQEVVERVFTYGNVAKKLVGLRCPESQKSGVTTLRAGVKVFAGEKDVGTVTSVAYLPWSDSMLARAMVRKPHYKAGEKLRAEGSDEAVEVYDLPDSFESNHFESKLAVKNLV